MFTTGVFTLFDMEDELWMEWCCVWANGIMKAYRLQEKWVYWCLWLGSYGGVKRVFLIWNVAKTQRCANLVNLKRGENGDKKVSSCLENRFGHHFPYVNFRKIKEHQRKWAGYRPAIYIWIYILYTFFWIFLLCQRHFSCRIWKVSPRAMGSGTI